MVLRILGQLVTPGTGSFVQQLRETLRRRAPATLDDEAAQRAAVAIVVTDEVDPALLLVKRRERAGDPWSGHAALPGGFQSAADADAAFTAERETEEETGLALAATGERLGALDDVYPRSVYLPRVIVTPWCFSVPGRIDVTPSAEIERALWVPIRDIAAPENRRPYSLDLAAGRREFDSIRVETLVVWGLTERVIAQLLTVANP
jgi:8-oxo-dGTP pyrophosphatase MutT (NUDIX family)